MEELKYKDIIELVYQAEEKVLDEKIKQANKRKGKGYQCRKTFRKYI